MSETKDSKPKRPAGPSIAASEPVEAAKKIAPVTALPQPVRRATKTAPEHLLGTYRDTLASVGEAQHALAKGMTALALEMTELAQAALTEAGDSTAALIRAGNLSAAVEIQLGYSQRSVASLIASTARLSEIGMRLMTEASRPIVAPLSGSARTG
jgi:hypothetical protein